MEYNGDFFEGREDGDKLDSLPVTDNIGDSFADGSFSDYTDLTGGDKQPTGEERYDEIFDTSKRNTRAFSIVSMVLGIISLICCCIGPLGLVLGIGAIIFSIVSRKSLGYFDGFSVVGLILGIFGACFGAVVFALLIFTEIFESIR